MSTTGNRRSSMTVYSDATSIESHRVRLMLAEKEIDIDLIPVDLDRPPEDLLHLNPQSTLPTIVDRDLVLYEARVIMDYLDERYPHPPLMPVDPVSRARVRLALFRIQADWYSLLPGIAGDDSSGDQVAGGAVRDKGLETSRASVEKARHRLTESLVASTDVFAAMPFFLSEEYSVLDATVVPLLWRLQHYGIVLPESAAPVVAYARRMFARPGFEASLTREEREMSA